jgi:hypothetical protein
MATGLLTNTDPIANFDFWGGPVHIADDGTYYCAGFLGDTYASNAFDRVRLGFPLQNPYTPGKAIVNVKKGRAHDRKKSAGADGERVTHHGALLAEVDIQIVIWTPEQLRALYVIWPLLLPSNGKGAPPAVSIYHPDCIPHNVSAVQFVEGSGPVDGPYSRSKVFTLRALQFAQPGKVVATVTDEGAGGSVLDPAAGAYELPPATVRARP